MNGVAPPVESAPTVACAYASIRTTDGSCGGQATDDDVERHAPRAVQVLPDVWRECVVAPRDVRWVRLPLPVEREAEEDEDDDYERDGDDEG